MCAADRFDCKIAVIKTDQHSNKCILSIAISGIPIFKMIVTKLMAPITEEDPAQSKLKMANSLEPPE